MPAFFNLFFKIQNIFSLFFHFFLKKYFIFVFFLFEKMYKKRNQLNFFLRRTKISGTHACLSIFQWRRTKCLLFPQGMLIFQPLPPYSMLKRSRRFLQSGKISGVLKIDVYMVRRSKSRALHRSMHPFTSTLNRGEGLLKIVTFPSRKRVFRLFTDTVEMSSEMRLYRN